MRKSATMLTAFSCCALSACNPSGGAQVDANLECSAFISAANDLMLRGEAEKDPNLAKRALISSMTYLNAYAIPKGIKEAEAFAEVTALREAMIESVSPSEIMSRAKRCVDRSPV